MKWYFDDDWDLVIGYYVKMVYEVIKRYLIITQNVNVAFTNQSLR